MLADKRFNSYVYKPRSKTKAEAEAEVPGNDVREDEQTSVPCTVRRFPHLSIWALRRVTPAVPGLVLLIAAELVAYFAGGYFVTSVATVQTVGSAAFNQFPIATWQLVATVLAILGAILVIAGVVRLIARLPRIVVSKARHAVNMVTKR